MRRGIVLAVGLAAALAAARADTITPQIGGGVGFGFDGGASFSISGQPLRSASSRPLVGQGFVSGLSAGFVQGQTRMRAYLGDAPLTELRLCYGNWGGQQEAVGPGNLTVEGAIELDGPLGFALVKWGGASSVTIAAGATACSDAVFPAAFGLTVFAANSTVWLRTGDTAVSNAGHPFSNLLSSSGEGQWAGPAFTSQVSATGAMTVPAGGSTVSGGLTPFAILGRYTVPMPSLCAIGDSINAGVNDTAITTTQGLLAGNGYVGRAAYNTYGDRIYPTFKLGIGGDGATPGGYVQRATFFKYCTHGLTAWGTNDINGGATPATVLANLRTAWASMASSGIPRIYSALVTPKTTTTDSWATEANQTYFSAAFSPGGNKDQLNTLIAADVGTHSLTGTLNFLSAVSGVDPDKWAVTGAANFCTSDGLHPSGACHGLMAPALQTILQSAGPQLPSQDISWVPTGADWAADFKNGRYYHVNCPSLLCIPLIASNTGIARTSVGYGVTANNSTGTLVQFGPVTARITPGRGLLAEKTTINVFANAFAPATQTATVSNATQYTVSAVGTGSLALSGACSGSVSAGSPVTCTTSSTSLTATVSGSLLAMQAELGAVATSPINGTRAAEDVGLPNSTTNSSFTFADVAGTIVLSVENTPPNVAPLLAAFGANYLNQASPTTVNNNRTVTLTATCGAGANGHTLSGITWDGSGRGLDCNGGTIATDANATGASGNQVYIGGQGSGGGDSTLNSYLQMMTHYPGHLTGATTPTFQQATTP